MFDWKEYTVFAGLILTFVQVLKPLYKKDRTVSGSQLLAIGLGIALALFTGFNVIGSGQWGNPYVGQVLSGILVGGAVGAGLIHDAPDFFLKLFARKAV